MRILAPTLVCTLAALAISGCNGSSYGGGGYVAPTPPPPVNTSMVDPTGDTMATGTTIYDITNFATSRTGSPGGTYSTIAVTITFVQAVVLPAAGASPDATQLAGFIFFDTDNNFSDGANFNFCGATGTYNGVDFAVDLVLAGPGRLADGNYPIVSEPSHTIVGEATVSVASNSATFTVPISAIGGSATGPFNVGTAMGNGVGPTDCAPNAGYATGAIVSRPPAHSWTLK